MSRLAAHEDQLHSRPVTSSANQVLAANAKSTTLIEEGTEESSSSEDKEDVPDEDGFEEQAKSAIYDYALEKTISHEESKLFYQRSRDFRHCVQATIQTIHCSRDIPIGRAYFLTLILSGRCLGLQRAMMCLSRRHRIIEGTASTVPL